MSVLEAAAVAFGAISVYLSARQIIWSWPTAIVNVLLYIFVFYDAKLYADMGLQVVYAVINTYGWYQWLRGGARHEGLHVTRTPLRTALVLALLAAVSAFVLGTAMDRYTDAALPYLDATLSTVSLAAQWMLARKFLENWLVWITLDIVYVPMFLYKNLHLTAGLYVVFLALSVMGFVEWRRAYRSSAKLAPVAAT
jgi:nicotinamide mononucleotide transporter